MNRPKFYIYLPIVFALLLILGIFIGTHVNLNNPTGNISLDANNSYSKVDEILRYEADHTDGIDDNTDTRTEVRETIMYQRERALPRTRRRRPRAR